MVANLAAIHGSLDALAERLSRDLDGAFTEVITQYEGAVFTTALRLCGRTEEAEDLSSETFLRAYSALRGYSQDRIGDLQLRPWLITICLNQWRNQLRSAARRPQPASPGAPAERERAAGDESPEDQVQRLEDEDNLVAALQRLPLRQRVAVVLRHIAGLPYVEVAEILACPEGTAKSHVSRGLDRLRILLANDHEVLP